MRSNKVLLSDTMILTEFILKSDILRRPQKFENVPLFLLMLLCKFKNKWLISSNFEGLLTEITRKKHNYIFEIEQVFLFVFLFSFMKFSGHINFFRDFFSLLAFCTCLLLKEKSRKKA